MTDKPIALVSGGAQGIGLACAEALAADGYKVILADIKDKKLSKIYPDHFMALEKANLITTKRFQHWKKCTIC